MAAACSASMNDLDLNGLPMVTDNSLVGSNAEIQGPGHTRGFVDPELAGVRGRACRALTMLGLVHTVCSLGGAKHDPG